MIFRAEIQKAKEKQERLGQKLNELKAAQGKISGLLAECEWHMELFERQLAEAKQTGEQFYVNSPPPAARRGERSIGPRDQRGISVIRTGWSHALSRLKAVQRRLQRKISKLTDRKLELDFWILEKEETWGESILRCCRSNCERS